MGLAPGRFYPGSPVRIGANFADEDGDDVDPTTVAFTLRSPAGTETTYTYGTDDEITRNDAGDYMAEVIPDEGGRWLYAWSTTGTNKRIRFEGNFIVQESQFSGYTGSWGSDYE